jgi:predicted DNA-binding mobile mystery protein A
MQPYRVLGETVPPRRGWISAIRKTLSMSARELGARLGVTQQRVAQIEKQEITGGLTIKALRQVAEGLNCRFVYGFIPNGSLEEIVAGQARRVAERRLSRAAHTMTLEDQGLNREGNDEILAELITAMTTDPPSGFWSEK